MSRHHFEDIEHPAVLTKQGWLAVGQLAKDIVKGRQAADRRGIRALGFCDEDMAHACFHFALKKLLEEQDLILRSFGRRLFR